MFTINWTSTARTIMGAVAAVSIGAGCSAVSAQRPAEVRVATRLAAGNPKLVVVGPARLLHVDVHGRQALDLYSVKRGTDGNVSCLDGARTQIRTLGQRANTELNLLVAAGEAICLTGDAAAPPRNSDVSWHARSASGAPFETAQASNP